MSLNWPHGKEKLQDFHRIFKYDPWELKVYIGAGEGWLFALLDVLVYRKGDGFLC